MERNILFYSPWIDNIFQCNTADYKGKSYKQGFNFSCSVYQYINHNVLKMYLGLYFFYIFPDLLTGADVAGIALKVKHYKIV